MNWGDDGGVVGCERKERSERSETNETVRKGDSEEESGEFN